jgi:hypothetical protein
MMKRHLLVALIMMSALACESAEPESQPALTRAELLNPDSCKDCHPKHYNEWSGSMHAYATKDPVFQAMNKRGQQETNGALGNFCVNCHAPMAEREKVITNYADLSNVPPELQGVTCYFCHDAAAVGADHVNATLTLADDDVMRAALPNAVQPSAHRVEYSANHDGAKADSSLLCGTCHDVRTPKGVHLERTLTEYLSSIEAETDPHVFQSCQSCHMHTSLQKDPAATSTGRPGVSVVARNLHEHLWAGVDVPLTDGFPNAAALRSAVETCELQQTIPYFDVSGSPRDFTISIESQAGHRQPSGTAQDRRMWVELVALDAAGNQLYEEGVVPDGAVEDPPAPNRHPFMMRDLIRDETGAETHMFWNAAAEPMGADVTTIPPATPAASTPGSHTVSHTYNVRVQATAKYQVRVRMRPMSVDVLQDLVSSGHLDPSIVPRMPTFTMTTREIVYDASTGQYKTTALDGPDCTEYLCLLDPASNVGGESCHDYLCSLNPASPGCS